MQPKQEGRAVAGNHCVMHLILVQCSE